MIQAFIGCTLALAVLLSWQFFYSLRTPALSYRLSAHPQPLKFRQSAISWLRMITLRFLEPNRKLQKVLFELPDFLDLLSVALASGDGIYSALKRVVPRFTGSLGSELALTLRALEFGSGLEFELHQLGQRLPQQQLVEMCNKMAQALGRGTPLSKMLVEQAEAVRQEIHSQLLKKSGRNETRMLIPLVFLILPVTVLFAIYPSLELLNITYL